MLSKTIFANIFNLHQFCRVNIGLVILLLCGFLLSCCGNSKDFFLFFFTNRRFWCIFIVNYHAYERVMFR